MDLRALDHLTTDNLQYKRTFNIRESKVKVTLSHTVSAVKALGYKSRTGKLTEFELGENYPRTERDTTHTGIQNHIKCG